MSSEEDYNNNRNYWKAIVADLFEPDLKEWVLNSYANGNEINDGNPLFSCKLNDNRVLRVIQEKRNPYSPIFASWVSTYEMEEGNVEELVIALQPYQDTYHDSQLLIESYLKGRYKLYQKTLNLKYNKRTNSNRINHLLKFLKETELENNSWNIERYQIISNRINYKLFKRIKALNENLFFFNSAFENKDLKKSYLGTLKSIDKLNTVISLKDSYDLDKGFKSDEYKEVIIKTYSNMHNYLKSYNTTVNDIEEKYRDLKQTFEKTTHNNL